MDTTISNKTNLLLDDVYLFDRALTNSEIVALYKGSLAIRHATNIDELSIYLVHDLWELRKEAKIKYDFLTKGVE
jgi:hypothetical protein